MTQALDSVFDALTFDTSLRAYISSGRLRRDQRRQLAAVPYAINARAIHHVQYRVQQPRW